MISRRMVSALALVLGLSVATVPSASYAAGGGATVTTGATAVVSELRVRWPGRRSGRVGATR